MREASHSRRCVVFRKHCARSADLSPQLTPVSSPFVPSAGYVTTLAGRIAGDPSDNDPEAFRAWQLAHRATAAVGLEAVFSDISGATFGILNNMTDPLVYVACMESGCVKSFDPRSRTCTYNIKMAH